MSPRPVLAGILFALLLSACQSAAPVRERRIVASIGPLADWARRVAGPEWQVQCLLPPGVSDHSVEYLPRDISRAERASLLIRVGSGLDPHTDALARVFGAGRTLTVTDGVPLIDGNPHVWLDPVVAREAAMRIARSLSALEPSDSAGFRARAIRFQDSLDSLDSEYRAACSTLRVRDFVSFHEAWVYLARRYGLRQAGAVEPAPGREPGPGDWAALLAEVRASGARAIFSEPQFGGRLPAMLASDAGVHVLELDPLGTTADPRGESYVALMRRNLHSLEQGLR